MSSGDRSRSVDAGLGLVLAAVLVRAISSYEPFPHWASDPLLMATPTTGLTPAISLTLDAATLIGAALLLCARRSGPGPLELTLWMAGALFAGLHAAVIDGGSLDNLATGSMWTAALAAGLAARACGADRRLSSFAAAALLGAIVLLVGKGLVQVLIEHPETVRTYRESKAAFLAAQGWTEGSAMARAFERRLYQSEATGWFGLSNVYASIMAAFLIAQAGLLIAALRDARPGSARMLSRKLELWLLTLGCVLAATGLALSQSKGGIGAAGLGLLVLLATHAAPRLLTRRPANWAMLAIPAAVLLLVAARGLLGEKLGELSLLFRWFYLQGAVKIIAAHPFTGVGPADFKEAYLLAKPGLSPEEVTSPHSVFFDYAATLGIGGLAWAALLVLWLWRSAPHQPQSEVSESHPVGRAEARWLLLLVAGAVLIGAWLEQATASIEMTLVRLVAIAGWMAMGLAIMQVLRSGTASRHTSIALAAAAITLLAHAQIEVTPVWPGSAGLFMMMLALAAGAPPAAATGSRRPGWALGPASMGAAAAAVLIATPNVYRWEGALRSAAESAGATVELRERVARAESGDARERALLSADLSRALSRAVPERPEALTAAARECSIMQLEVIERDLARAAALQPHHFPTARSLSRARLELSAACAAAGRAEPSAAARSRAEREMSRFAEAHPTSSAAWGWLGTIREGLSNGSPAGLHAACEAWERAAALDPYGLEYPPVLARAYRTLGELPRSRAWAESALRINELHRLDPLQQLPPAELAEMRSLAAG